MEPYKVASKILAPENGLNRERIINCKVIFDCTNRNIIVEGFDYTYAPNGAIINQVPFRYERDNIPEVKEVVNAEGVVTTAFVPANNRFNNNVASPVGLAIASMIQQTLDTI